MVREFPNSTKVHRKAGKRHEQRLATFSVCLADLKKLKIIPLLAKMKAEVRIHTNPFRYCWQPRDSLVYVLLQFCPLCPVPHPLSRRLVLFSLLPTRALGKAGEGIHSFPSFVNTLQTSVSKAKTLTTDRVLCVQVLSGSSQLYPLRVT